MSKLAIITIKSECFEERQRRMTAISFIIAVVIVSVTILDIIPVTAIVRNYSLFTTFQRNFKPLHQRSEIKFINRMMSYERFKDIDSYESEAELFESNALNTIASKALPIQDLDTSASKMILNVSKSKKVVCIGEASHGTREFYQYRNEITKNLIVHGNCKGVLIEGDFPSVSVCHAYVTNISPNVSIEDCMNSFQRFPTWIWSNESFKSFLEWLKEHNSKLLPQQRCGIFGLDLYSFDTSMNAITSYVKKNDPEALATIKSLYQCFDRVANCDSQAYGYMTEVLGRTGCQQEFQRAQEEVKHSIDRILTSKDPHNTIECETAKADLALIHSINAQVVIDAEKYYRSMFKSKLRQRSDELIVPMSSWELRDTHFFKTLTTILSHLEKTRGPDSTVAVWAHNSHIGDARYVFAGTRREVELGVSKELNIGQLVKERFGDDSLLIGQLTYDGAVTCADDWDGPRQSKLVRKGLAGSWEEMLKLVSDKITTNEFALNLHDDEIRRSVSQSDRFRLNRCIGVIYRPETERLSHYFFSDLVHQFDVAVFFRRTSGVIAIDQHPRSVSPIAEELGGLSS